MNYYVYGYFDPRNEQLFYIGKGKGGRWLDHLKETKEKTDNIFKWRKINSIRQDGHEPVIRKLHDKLTEVVAYDMEAALIKQYGRVGIEEGGILTNRCEDLRPPSHKGRPKSEEQKQKMRDAYWKRVSQPGYVHPCKGRPCQEHVKKAASIANSQPKTEEMKRKVSETKKRMFAENPSSHPWHGRHHTEEVKEKISATKTGHSLTPEHVEKVRQARIGSHHSKITKERIAKSHSQKWELDNGQEKVIVENLSAWCRERGFSPGNFWLVANGRLPHAYGYKCQKLD